MSGFADYDDYDATGLAELVAKGEVRPEDLLEEAIGRTERLNPKLNAITLKYYEEARAAIREGLPEGPFRGVPFLLKDLHLLLKGMKTTQGSALYEDFVADHNSTLTERYLQAGLVIFGKTNTPEFGLAGTTEPRLWGPTRNPWNEAHSAGGSSGGAAAAVAAGIVPVAHASDGGGSIRIPASACGLFGMKPTRGRTPFGPDRGEGWAGMSISHVVSRTVRDSAALLDATSGTAPGDPYEVAPPERPFAEEMSREPGRLRIAWNTKRPDGSLCHPEVAKGLEETVSLLEGLGHHLEEAAPVFDREAMAQTQTALIGSNTALALKQRGQELGRNVTQNDVENITWAIAERAKATSGEDYAAAVLFIHQLGRMMATFHEKWDVYLCPTLGEAAPELGVLDMSTDDVARYMEANNRIIPFTGAFNMTGQPSMSVPLCQTPDGLPVGMMFTAAFGQEGLLYRLAGQLEKAQPFKRLSSLEA